MSKDEVEVEEEVEKNIGDQFTKMILGSIAGFGVAKLVEHIYDKIVDKSRSQSAEIEQ